MLTRGRHSNTAYLITVGDGDPHSLIHPDTINPATPTDQLERILARDESPLSATTQLRQATDPTVRLGDAAGRYRDAIVFAAGHIASDADRHTIAFAAERLLPGITKAEAWPALLAQLLTIEADQRDPINALTRAAADPLTAGRDPAAILASRLDDTTSLHRRGPLPWLRPIPARLAADPTWGSYLTARADLVTDLADQVRHQAETSHDTSGWVGDAPPPAVDLAGRRGRDVAGSQQCPSHRPRPTGEPQTGSAAARWQHRLGPPRPARTPPRWTSGAPCSPSSTRQISRDPSCPPSPAERLGQISSAGINIRPLLHQAAAEEPLPDDHAAAALWWRLSSQLTRSRHRTSQQRESTWSPTWTAATVRSSHRHRCGLADLREEQLVANPGHRPSSTDSAAAGPSTTCCIPHPPRRNAADECQAWVWRLTLVTQTRTRRP